MLMCCLCLASKVWDDDSLENLENVHFPKVMPNVTTKEISLLEQAFIEFIDYNLVVKDAEYAKYYLVLRSLTERVKGDNILLISDFDNENGINSYEKSGVYFLCKRRLMLIGCTSCKGIC